MRKIKFLLTGVLAFCAIAATAKIITLKEPAASEDPNAFRILFIGDSITLHGFGDWTRELGWNHESGMAASSLEKDYVHLFARKVQEQFPGRNIEIHYLTAPGGTAKASVEHFDRIRSVRPHLVVVEVGGNNASESEFREYYPKVLDLALQMESRPSVIALGCWSPVNNGSRGYTGEAAQKEAWMRAQCRQRNILFASVQEYATDPACSGTGTSSGVAWHPNDKGMEGYAAGLFRCFQWLQSAPPRTEILVDADRVIGEVDKNIFGHNVEAGDPAGIHDSVNAPPPPRLAKYGQGFWDGDSHRPFPAVIDKMKELKTGILRYPGGCLAHNFNWKKMIGKPEERKPWQFGLDEYLAVCRAMGAEPMITFTDYALPAEELPKHGAELVEYLNMPATPEYPWAMKRKENGHPEPYGVKFFELGNETDHGNHDCVPGRRYTPEAYCEYAINTAKAMKAVDPGIRIGIVAAPGVEVAGEWNPVVFAKAVPAVADFVSVHYYGPALHENGTQERSEFQAAAWSARMDYYIDEFHKTLVRHAGRDFPLAVTEYNAWDWDQSKTYLGGFSVANYLRTFLDPKNRIIAACHWQLLNDLWGIMGSDYKDKIAWRSAAMPFLETFISHTGKSIVASEIKNNPLCEVPSFGGRAGSRGDRKLPAARNGAAMPLGSFMPTEFAASGLAPRTTSADSFTVEFKNYKQQSYPNFLVIHRPRQIPLGEPMMVKLKFQAMYTPAPGTGADAVLGLGLSDLRGWEATRSAIAVTGLERAGTWTDFEGIFITRPDCPGFTAVFRVENISGQLSGTLKVRNIRLFPWKPETFPAFPALGTLATRSADGKSLYVTVFNNSPVQPVGTTLRLDHFPASSVTVTELYSENTAIRDAFEPAVFSQPVSGNSVSYLLMPLSMTVFEFKAETP